MPRAMHENHLKVFLCIFTTLCTVQCHAQFGSRPRGQEHIFGTPQQQEEPAPELNPALQQMPLAALFHEAVVTSDSTRHNHDYKTYTQMRQALLARGDEALPFLEQKLASSKDWRETISASALIGWIRYPELYTSLSRWKPPAGLHQFRNPFPSLAAATYATFSKADRRAIPLMLELLWKRNAGGDAGGLSRVLAEWRVGAALPILAVVASSEHIMPFGSKATPFLLDSLRDLPSGSDPREAVKALGLIGDAKALAALRDLVRLPAQRALGSYDRRYAAAALATAKDFAWLREQYDVIDDPEVRVEVLSSLGQDKSAQTRAFLKSIATRPSTDNDSKVPHRERFEAVKALLDKATQEDIVTACEIALREPDGYTRSDMYIYVARPSNAVVRETLLKSLENGGVALGRILEGLSHYKDKEVTRRVLSFTKDKDPRIRSTAISALGERADPEVVAAAIRLLQDTDADVVLASSAILRHNPTPEAFKPLVALLAHPASPVRFQAAWAIHAIGGHESALALQKAQRVEKDDQLRKELQALIDRLYANPQPKKLP